MDFAEFLFREEHLGLHRIKGPLNTLSIPTPYSFQLFYNELGITYFTTETPQEFILRKRPCFLAAVVAVLAGAELTNFRVAALEKDIAGETQLIMGEGSVEWTREEEDGFSFF